MAMMSGRRMWAIGAFAVIALAGLATAGAVIVPERREASSVERPAQPVRVTIISFAASERVLTYTGTIRPRHEIAMGFRVAGKIVSRGAEVGDRVTRGQVLARLDDSDARLQMELATAEAEAAAVDHRRALAEVQRSRSLFAEGHLAQAALDRAVSAEAEAFSRRDRAGRTLALARNGLDYTQLRADVDGVVTATLAEAGQVIAAGSPVVDVAEAGAVDAVFAMPEKDHALVRAGKARGSLWGEDDKSYDLTLRDVSPDADPLGRTYRVRMALDAPDGYAAFGRTVAVEVVATGDAPVAKVPLAAVIDDGKGPAVWRVAGGDRVERVAVTLAEVTGEVVAIRGPLGEGDAVVSLGAQKVDPARPVRVAETYAVAGE